MSQAAASRPERKRQARGEARIKSLLEAAEKVFARDGYHAATTNEIAATAQVSPATLYQFFRNKDELANALLVNYTKRIAEVHASMDFEGFAKMDLPTMVSALTDPILNFHKSLPAFLTLLIDAPISSETLAAKQAMSENFIKQMSKSFRKRNPAMKSSDADWAAQICMLLYRGFIAEIIMSPSAKQRRLLAEFKQMVVRRLEEDLG